MKKLALCGLAAILLGLALTMSLVMSGTTETPESHTENVREPIAARGVTQRPEVQPPPPETQTQVEQKESGSPETVRFSVRVNATIADGPPPPGYQIPEFPTQNTEK